MILGVNGIRLVRNHSGVARAIEALLCQFGQIEQPFDDIRVYSPRPIDESVKLPAIARNIVVKAPLPPGLWEQIALPWAHGARNVLFCPSYTAPILARCPMLLTHHGSYEGYDARREVFGWWTRTKARLAYHASARCATAVTTVSEFSRADMVRFYGLPAARIEVIPNGVDLAVFRPLDDTTRLREWRQRWLGSDVPFLLYVGKPTKRRNLPNLLRAFKALKRDACRDHKLVLVGTALPGSSFESMIGELNLADDVVAVPHASHSEIAVAYNACSAMVYPSSYEGFGMPVLEAMACGAPVITLDNTAFPEFAAGVAMLLPDAEVGTLARGIREVLGDSTLRARMRAAGPLRAATYDWRMVAQRYLDLLVPLAAQHAA